MSEPLEVIVEEVCLEAITEDVQVQAVVEEIRVEVYEDGAVEVVEVGLQGPAGAPGLDAGGNLPPIPFSYGDASPVPVYVPAVPSLVVSAAIHVRTPFNGFGAALELGIDEQPGLLMPAAYNDPATSGEYENTPDVTLSAGQQVLLTVTPGAGATQGAGVIILRVLPL